MKLCIKYEYGYINIDDAHIYLTNTGNWAEARKLQEKSKRNKRKNSIRIIYKSIFLYAVLTGCIIWVILSLTTDSSPFMLLLSFLSTASFGYSVYQYFRTELGKRYKIPLSKIQSLRRVGESLELEFLDEDSKQSQEIIKEVEPNGFEQLEYFIRQRIESE